MESEMDRFMFSDKPNGPWFSLREHTTAHDALAAAQQSFRWQTTVVAKMRPCGPDDVLPPHFIEDLVENLVLKHGNALAEEIIQRIKKHGKSYLNAIWDATAIALEDDEPIWVAEMTHQYGPNDSVRPADFNPELQAEISRQKTREAIEAQEERHRKEEKELEEWKKRQEKKPKLDELI